MEHCWEQRGCDDQMWPRCPHATASTDGLCVADCFYAQCHRLTYQVTTDYELLLDPTVDRHAAIREVCFSCGFFLKHAPRVK